MNGPGSLATERSGRYAQSRAERARLTARARARSAQILARGACTTRLARTSRIAQDELVLRGLKPPLNSHCLPHAAAQVDG